MRVLFTRFPLESALGGAEIQTLSLMEGLMERGHEVSFAGSCPVLLAECRKRGIPVIELDIGAPPVTKWGATSFAWRKAGMGRKLKALLARDKIQDTRDNADVIIMLSLSEKLLLTDIAADAGTKVMWVEHDRIGRWLTQNPWLAMLKKQSKKAVTICVSELSKRMYIDLGWSSEQTIAIADGVSIQETRNKRQETDAAYRLGCIARLSKEKGVDVLINALATLSDNYTLEIVGTGREESTLKQLAKQLKLDQRVTFTPHEDDVARAFDRWDALILPSREHDPFGMVAAEAMLYGLPVVVTDQCGIADYLEDGKDAIVVRADSVNALKDGIEKLRASSVELREHGKKTAEEKFSIKTMVERYEDVFTSGVPHA